MKYGSLSAADVSHAIASSSTSDIENTVPTNCSPVHALYEDNTTAAATASRKAVRHQNHSLASSQLTTDVTAFLNLVPRNELPEITIAFSCATIGLSAHVS